MGPSCDRTGRDDLAASRRLCVEATCVEAACPRLPPYYPLYDGDARCRGYPAGGATSVEARLLSAPSAIGALRRAPLPPSSVIAACAHSLPAWM